MTLKNYYIIPFFLYFFSYVLLFLRKKDFYQAFIFLIYFAFAVQSVIIFIGLSRYELYNSIKVGWIIFFNSWILMLVIILFSLLYKTKSVIFYVTPLAGVALLISYFVPAADIKTALQADSGLLIAHIFLIVIGDSLFALAFIVSLIYIFQERRIKLKKNLMLFDKNKNKNKVNKLKEVFYLGKGYNLELLDNMNYQSLKFGFPILTAGIIIGIYLSSTLFNSAISIKPIEIISLITWLIYAVLLHERVAKGARGKKAAIFSIIGFLMILATVALSLYLFPQFHGVR